MAGSQRPALTSTTKPNNTVGVTEVPTPAARKVTYIFQCTTAANVSLPYVVAINDKVIPAHEKKVSRVSSGAIKSHGKTRHTEGRFVVDAEAGDRISLYLNSDAAVGYRTSPVYAVTVGARDIVVKITEKEGLLADSDTPTLVAKAKDDTKAGKSVDEYSAPLTGSIWMKVSHKYSSAEVDALMPAGTKAEIVTAIKSIYNGLPSAALTVSTPAVGAQAGRSLKVTFVDSNNPKANIVGYSLLKDGLTRVHPGGFAALLNAALDNNISSLQVTSCWRPMLGSIAHRAGLGLDVGYVGSTRMNRQELRSAFEGKNPSKKGNGVDTDNVSDAEVEMFGKYEAAIAISRAAEAGVARAEAELATAKRMGDPAKISEAEAKTNEAAAASRRALNAEKISRKAWNDERDAAEPVDVRVFRSSLLKCPCVWQLFDPWVMDKNTRNANGPEENMQRGNSSSDERLHAHHLHITVHDPRILSL